MKEGLNKATLIGNLGADPEIRFGQSGNAVLRLRLATTERFKDRNGDRQERTEWHTVVFFGNRAEGLNKHLGKGQSVYVEGRIQTRQWEDREGQKRYTTEIVGQNLLFLGGGSRDGGSSRGGYESPGEPDDMTPNDDFGDDDIPF